MKALHGETLPDPGILRHDVKNRQRLRERNGHRSGFKSISNFGDDGLQIDDKQLFDRGLDILMNVAVCDNEVRGKEYEAASYLDETRMVECP